MKPFYLACLILLVTPLGAQDSTWIKMDLEAYQTARPMASYQEAIAYMVDYFQLRKASGPITKELAENYRKTAIWYRDIALFQQAYNYIDTAIQLQQQIPDLPPIDKARAEYIYGEILYNQNLLGSSEYWYDKALSSTKIAVEQNEPTKYEINRIQYSTSRSSLVAAQSLNFAKADLLNDDFKQFYDKYAHRLDPVTAKLNLIENLISQGINLQKQERFEEALGVYEQAFSPEYRALENNYSTEESDWRVRQIVQNIKILRGNYANTYIEAGDNATAELILRKLLEEMLALDSEGLEFGDRIVITYGYLLNALQGQGKYDKMLPIYNDAIVLRYKIDSTKKGRNLGLINTFMGEAANKQGDYATAAEYFAKARYNFVGDATPLGAANLPRIKGNLIYGQEEFLYFLQAYREALVREADAGNDQALEYALATARSIDSLLQRGVAQLSLTASVGGFLRLENRHYQRGIDLALRLYRERGEQQYLTEAFSFASVQKANLLRRYLGAQELANSFDVPQAVVGEKVRLETRVLVLEQALADTPGERETSLRQQLLAEQQALSEIRRELDREYPAFSLAMRGASMSDPFAAAKKLEPDQQVVEYFLGQDSIYLFSLTAFAGLTYKVVPRPDNLEQLIKDAVAEDTVAAETLYDLLVAPVANQMDKLTRLQVIPDGILWDVPFEALRVQGRYLIYQRAVSYAYSSAILFAAETTRTNGSGYLGYGISYDDVLDRINTSANRSGADNRLRSMGHLPYAEQEVEYVANLLNTAPVLGELATKDHFFTTAPKVGILHLALHGIREENPMESALVFQGSTSGKYELLRMQELLGKRFPTKLTVLSACHSGNGPLEAAEGRQSIGRAFAAAGSKAIITSNWAAPDRATNLIIQETFTQIKAGLPTDVALQQGILLYLEESSVAERSLKNWAHLSLTGSVNPVYPQSFWKWGLLAFCSLATIACLLFLYSRIKSNRKSTNNS